MIWNCKTMFKKALLIVYSACNIRSISLLSQELKKIKISKKVRFFPKQPCFQHKLPKQRFFSKLNRFLGNTWIDMSPEYVLEYIIKKVFPVKLTSSDWSKFLKVSRSPNPKKKQILDRNFWRPKNFWGPKLT